MKEKMFSKEALGVIVILVLFIASAMLAKQHEQVLQGVIEGYGYWGMFFYVLLTIVSVVLAPVNTFFLLPVASVTWGPAIGAVLSIIGWTIGSLIAYYLARTFGRPFVKKIVDLKKIDRVSSAMPKKNVFMWIVLARMVVSVDILSYALGLFLPVPYTTYTLATLIGVSPFAFIFAYTLHESPVFVFVAAMLATCAVLVSYVWFKQAMRTHEE